MSRGLGDVYKRQILNKPEYFKNERVGVILSGGNLDLEDLPW